MNDGFRGLAKALSFWAMLLFACAVPVLAQANPVIGEVSRLKQGATVIRGEAVLPATMNMALQRDDTVSTIEGARLEVTFEDGTTLSLGENATITLDSYVYNPDEAQNELSLSVLQGAFLFISGDMGKQAERTMQVRTAFATIGIRGTTFWGGPLDNPLDVLLLDGKIDVQSPGGAVVLDRPGKGTTITAPGQIPTPPTIWPEDKRKRAFATVAF